MLYSLEHKNYLKKRKKEKWIILFSQISILIIFIFLWQYLSNKKIINTFLFSSPKLIINTITTLFKSNNLFNHINITIYETLISFTLSILIGIIVASVLWWNKYLYKIFDPYLTIINSLPKVALGPILIIWIGANIKSIIAMSLLISSIINIINIYNGFNNTDIDKIKLMESFGATKWQIYKLLILRGNISTMISSLKINISMCLIGLLPPVGEKSIF